MKDFLKEEFVLPEKWCIRVTDENKEIVQKWRNKNNYVRDISKGDIVYHDCCYSIKSSRGINSSSQEITFEQFKKYVLKEEEFVLPEKWCVKTTPNTRQLILDFIISKGYNSGGPLSYDYYLHFPLLESKGSAYSYPKIGYTEITFEQFKKYVLKEEEKMIDKINDEFIVDCLNNTDKERREVYKFLVDTRFYSKLYLSDSYSVIVCRKKHGNSNYGSLENAKYNHPLLPVLTFEEFKRKYLKEETMENNKKLIGYKLIKPEYKEAACKIGKWASIEKFEELEDGCNLSINGYHYDLLKTAGVLDLWFEPVYEEEFKVGDWVITTIETDRCYEKHKKGEVFQITEITSDYLYFAKHNAVRKDRVRKATPEEIKKASTIEIGGYKVEFLNKEYCSINSVEYNKTHLESLKYLMGKKQIKSLNVGCSGQYRVDLELLEKILAKF